MARTSWLLALFTVLACSKPATHGVRVFSPRCPAQADLEPTMRGQMRFIDQTLENTGLELLHLDAPTKSEFLEAIGSVDQGWLMLSYTGHGSRPDNASSHLCVAQGQSGATSKCSSAQGLMPVNDCVLKALPARLSGATIILDACQSAQIDPRQAPIPTSIISSSPYVVDSTSLFGDRLALALADAAEDPNCDGLVTDQELFDSLLEHVYRDLSVAEHRTFPKLRRNATSQIPLPTRPRPRKACSGVRAEMQSLIEGHRAAWGPLAEALGKQLELDPLTGSKQTLPAIACDYYVLDSQTNDVAVLKEIAKKARLCAFPEASVEVASKVARFAIFTEIYLLSSRCGWASVTRLRDGQLVSAARTSELDLTRLKRRMSSERKAVSGQEKGVPGDGKDDLCQVRYLGVVPPSLAKPVHCSEPDGQCFLQPCSEVLGGPR